MKKFSKILENSSKGKYKIWANIELEIEATDEGEAAYIADSILSSVKDSQDWSISKLEKINTLLDSKSEK
jgi:hypothetical protein